MANKKSTKTASQKLAQLGRSVKNKARRIARNKPVKGDGIGKLRHSLNNRLKRIARRLKEGVGVEQKAKLEARRPVIAASLESLFVVS